MYILCLQVFSQAHGTPERQEQLWITHISRPLWAKVNYDCAINSIYMATNLYFFTSGFQSTAKQVD